MKSQLRNCAVGRSTRPTKLASRFDNNKENICTDWHLDQLVACRLGKISVTPTTVLPRKHKNLYTRAVVKRLSRISIVVGAKCLR
jgi:hypothetical protein